MFFQKERKAAAALRNLMAQTRDTMVCFEFRTPVDPSEPQHVIDEKLRDATIVEASTSFARYFGFKNSTDVIGQPLIDLFDGDIPTWFSNYGREVESRDFENIERHVDIPVGDSVRPMRIYMQNIFEEKLLVSQWITIRDVSETAEQARVIAENEQLKLLALEAVGLHTYSLDFSGASTGPEHGTMSVGDSFVSNWWDYIHPDDKPNVEKAFANFYKGADAQMHTLFRTVRPDGTPAWMESWTIASHRDEDGKPQGIAGVIMDRSESKALEQKLAEGHRLESLGVMAGGIAHDFNNLLMSITGSVDLLNRNHPELKQALKVVDDAARQAAQLCDHLLTYAGRGTGELEPLNLGRVVENLHDLVRVGIHKSANLVLTVEDDCWVRGNASQLTQVVMNLAQNASDALEGESGEISIRVKPVTYDKDWYYNFHLGRDLPPGEYVAVEVRDTGSGIADVEYDRLFDPFYTTKFTGRGLGLAVVLGIVRGHSGAIRLDSTAAGTTATVVFPRQNIGVEANDAPVEPIANGTLSGCVLVVDDEPAVRTIAEVMLTNLGVDVVLANDGYEAIERVEATPDKFDVMLIDVTMPGMDGVETANRILEQWPHSSIVICSGYSNVVMSSKMSQQVEFLQKPYRLADLESKLQKLLQAKST